jgi:group I intron endonuclease
MQETMETGVIYMITNNINNKKYIGKAFSYEKHGKKPPSVYGSKGRFKRHKSNVNNGSNEIPLLYEDMRKYGADNFSVETLEVCLKPNLKARETYYTQLYKTFENDIGYNYHVGDNKPKDDNHLQKYKDNKVQSNKTRAVDGKLRQSDDVKDLPTNIYKRTNGYFVQIKIDGTLYNKSFLSAKDTDDVKLQKAKTWLANLQQQFNEIEV